MKGRKLTIQLDESTARWLIALAHANQTTGEAMLAQAASCMADYAGRRPGSCEADVGAGLLRSSGWEKPIGELALSALRLTAA